MNISHTIIGLGVGIAIGAMDFSLARGIAGLVRPSNARAAQALLFSGFIFRIGAVGLLLWTISRAESVSFIAVCVGLTSAFTVLALWHALKSFTGTARIQKQVSDRR